ncbi:adenine deaminase [Halalkalibacterium ligniniphilum]|uniref:adenine deaminase n=1 Tax=Halalkalibacterium ligniniphilum TaxID=1134413 RepID=UPI0012674242|nr:adenine deaminase [Halalkalibacterium ligniniphilum]
MGSDKMDRSSYEKKIAVAVREQRADFIIKNSQIIDVFNLEIIEGDVVIAEGEIVAIGASGEYSAEKILDAEGAYLTPSFIDGHVHIESSMVSPEEFAKVVVPRGVTTVMADPHEIANVAGVAGIHYMLEASMDLPLDVKMMVPSCVPATPFENNGATVDVKDIAALFEDVRVWGLGEVMDYPSVFKRNPAMIDKLLAAYENHRFIDGHGAGLTTEGINAYRAAGIRNDHEAVTAEEAKMRLMRGMYLLIREGTAAKDLDALIEAVTPQNSRRCLFVTDDKHLDDLIREGSIDHSIRRAIQKGIDPLIAIQMASLNAAECFQLNSKGAIAPGYEADMVLLKDLEAVEIMSVFKQGKLVASDGVMIESIRKPVQPPATLLQSVKLKQVTREQLQIPMKNSERANIIEVTPHSIMTKHVIDNVDVKNGCFEPSVENGQLKLVVAERHKELGNVGVGIVKGIPLQDGAIVASVAHDSHNIVALGTNDEDILTAINHVEQLQGGMAVVKDGTVISSLPLRLAGLMSDERYEKVEEQLHSLHSALKDIGFRGDFNPFLTLSFLALPVIPEIKLTDQGLFDVVHFQAMDVQAK